MCKKGSCVVSAAIVMAIAAIILFPVTGTAQENWYPWSKKLKCDNNACPRFKLVLDGDAVLDRETGLVWEKSPSKSEYDWNDAHWHCNSLGLGNRMGWRLPTVQELASLMDPTQGVPSLPIGHPFHNVQPSFYWSATTMADDTMLAWDVLFADGRVGSGSRSVSRYAWCVRGGQGVDSQ